MTRYAGLRQMKQAVKQHRKELIAIGRFVHSHPELGFKEYKAADRLSAYLREIGYEIEMPYGGLDTAFRAVLKGARRGRSVAVLAEYDALAGVGHACGHNLIATAAVTAAVAVAGGSRKWPGRFEVIGTPAEEIWAGKSTMVANGAFDHLDVAFMTHPSSISRKTAPTNAFRSMHAVFRGKPAHAGGCPDRGVNALDAAVQVYVSLSTLRQQLREDTRIHMIIPQGGEVVSVIPERAVIEIGIRNSDEAYLDALQARVTTVCRSAAKCTGTRVSVHWKEHGFRALVVNPPLDAVLAEGYEAAGIRLGPPAPRGNRASLDMGNISRIIPAAHPYFNIFPKGKSAPAHDHAFRRQADTPLAYDRALKAGLGMGLAAIDLLTRPEKLRAIRSEFRTRNRGEGKEPTCL